MPSLHKELTKDDSRNTAKLVAKDLFDVCERIVVPKDSRPFQPVDPTDLTKEEQATASKIRNLVAEIIKSESERRWPSA